MSILPPTSELTEDDVPLALVPAQPSVHTSSSRRWKRAFDLFVTLTAAIAWVPVVALSALAILLLDGGPAFYVSPRRVYRRLTLRVFKFRTMRRDAERVANRATVPVEDGVRFLNIPHDSPLYTGIGRRLERYCFTELPQLFHVLAGSMSLVGNRPLPENVIEALRQAHPHVEERFDTPAGLTGPIQLVGREKLTDAQRLAIETRYCQVARSSYSMQLDFMILLYTVLVVTRLRRSFSPVEVERMISSYDRSRTA